MDMEDKHCRRKHSFDNKKAARNALAQMRKRHTDDRGMLDLNVYRCRFCSFWHVGKRNSARKVRDQ